MCVNSNKIELQLYLIVLNQKYGKDTPTQLPRRPQMVQVQIHVRAEPVEGLYVEIAAEITIIF